MSIETLRDSFPILEATAYLNAGTCGPVPAAAVEAARATLDEQLTDGRSGRFYVELDRLTEELRARYARLLGAGPHAVAVTAGSSDGIARVIAGLRLGPGDEILTADDEHPGLLGPLIDAREHLGVQIREVPLERIADEIEPRTHLVACSHVSWRSGRLAPVAELVAAAGDRVPVIVDGAQSAGAIALDIPALGVPFYAGSGQKWLCGPVGTGMLYADPHWHERLRIPTLHYGSLHEPGRGISATPAEGARRFDRPSLDLTELTLAVAAFDVLAEAGWDEVHERAAAGAEKLAAALAEQGRKVIERDRTTLVSWDAGGDDRAAAERWRLNDLGVVIRDLPGTGYLRASVGAWSNDDDIERLLDGLAQAG